MTDENLYSPDANMTQLFSSTGVPITIENTAIQEVSPTEVSVIDNEFATEEEQDLQLVRSRYKDLESKANKAIDELGDLARGTEAPRMYEVLSTMINSAANLNKELMALHKNRGNKDTPSQPAGGVVHNHQQNIVFTGTPAELLANMKALNAANK
jgi:hypothetical protein